MPRKPTPLFAEDFDNDEDVIDVEMEFPQGDPDAGMPALADETLPTTLYILPLSERPFFPAQTQPLLMNKEPWMETVKAIGDSDHHLVGLIMTDDHESKLPAPGDFREF